MAHRNLGNNIFQYVLYHGRNWWSSIRQDVRVRKFIDENCERFGTTVSVDGLFYNLAVRLKALRSDVEMNHVKEFMQRMSVLHHSIQMTLIDALRKKTVFRVKSQSSVSKRFISLHGLKLYLQLQVSASIVLINCPPFHFTVLQEVRMTVGSYTIGGLLSPPVNECCHWTKDFQYMYLNSRWLRNTDIVSSLIDRLYRRTLTSKIAGNVFFKQYVYRLRNIALILFNRWTNF